VVYYVLIKKCKIVEEADGYFDLLQKTQELLARLFFKQEITMSKGLEKFVSDFDRVDDNWLRDYLFNAIKRDEYSL